MSGSPGSEPTRFTDRAAALLFAGAGFAVLALLLRNPALLLVAVPLLAAPVAAFGAAPDPRAPAEVEWSAGGSGREVEVTGRVRLPDGVRSEGIVLEFQAPDPLRPVSPMSLERRAGEIGLYQRFVAEFPCLAILPRPAVAWRDPLGLVERAIPVGGSALRLERFPPEIARLRAPHLRRTTVYPGEVLSHHQGGAGDFFAIRPSAPGDTPRQINWSASARSGQLLANEYLLERTGDLLIVLDLRPTPLGPTRDGELLAMARAAAFGIASAFLSEKARVGLATFDEYVNAVPLGSGRLQRYRLRRQLESARVGEVAGPPERLGVALSRFFPKGIGTLVLSSLAGEDSPVLLAHLRRRGYAPFVLAPSPLPLLTARGSAEDRRSALAARLLRLARRQQLALAWTEAPVVDWEDYWSLTPFVRFLGRPATRTTGVGL